MMDTTTNPPIDLSRKIKNKLAIDGVIDTAFKAILESPEPDAIHAYVVGLAHSSVDVAMEAVEKDRRDRADGVGASAELLNSPLREALQAASEWISAAPHGDNCFLHDDGGEYDACFCGKDSLLNHVESTLAALTTTPQPSEPTAAPAEPKGTP